MKTIDKKRETTISIIAYKEPFKSALRKGWGCGYVYIPKEHPILIKLTFDPNFRIYLEPDGFSDDITLSEWSKDGEHYIIGFDTAHLRSNSIANDKAYVLRTVKELKSLVDAYTLEDAKEEYDLHIENLKLKRDKELKSLRDKELKSLADVCILENVKLECELQIENLKLRAIKFVNMEGFRS